MSDVKTALLSTSDKTGLPAFARRLAAMGVKILSTGGTAHLLRQNGIEVRDVSDYTGFPEILDGRVKTLHPKIHGGLLALRDNAEHREEMEKHEIQAIDMVVVNLYPFESTIQKPNVQLMAAIENIDIGGPTLIRSAAKNYTHVAVVTNPADYDALADELERNDATLSEETRFRLAVKAFQHTAHYDSAIADYLAGLRTEVGHYRDIMFLELHKRQGLRYGENPHQRAAFYVDPGAREPSVGTARQIAGPELSFNNILDINAALELVKEFDQPAAVVIKHTNPCGAGIGETLRQAYEKAYRGDPVSAFGSVLALNLPLDAATAEAVVSLRAETPSGQAPYFVEAIIAPSLEDGAVEIITQGVDWGKRTRILETGALCKATPDRRERDVRRVVGGYLVQDRDVRGFEPDSILVATEKNPTEDQMKDLAFAWICCKHIKSNTIALAKDGMLVGVGAGQMSRLDSSIIAARKAGERAQGSVMASDAFFPFPDAVEEAAKAGVAAIIQPGGARKDDEVVAAANRLGMAMVLTGVRHFRH